MDNYTIILNELTKFFDVNDVLRASLEKYSLEITGRPLDQNVELFARTYANAEHTEAIIDELQYMNQEPHDITEMEVMYQYIDDMEELKQ